MDKKYDDNDINALLNVVNRQVEVKEAVLKASQQSEERKARDEEDREQRKLRKKIVIGTAVSVATIAIVSTGFTICRGVDYLSESGQKVLNSNDFHFYQDADGSYFADGKNGIDLNKNDYCYALVTDFDINRCAEVLRENGYTDSEVALVLGNTFGWDKADHYSALEKPSFIDVMKTAVDAGNQALDQEKNNSRRGSK